MRRKIRAIEIREVIDHSLLFEMGIREFFPAGAALLLEGTQPDKMYLVIKGELSVTLAGLQGNKLARLHAGELIGEMAFLEGSKASATIHAERDTVVLSITYAELNQRLKTDDHFASQLYRAFALTAERRLRHRVERLTDPSYCFRHGTLADVQAAQEG